MVFCGAILLFGLEPLAGRLLTPYFGGAAHVWLTCLMFFQAVLFVGYLYAHLFARKLGVWHLAILALPLVNLPAPVYANRTRMHRFLHLLYVLSLYVALPFAGALHDGRRGPGMAEPVPARQAPGALSALCRIQRGFTDRAPGLHVRAEPSWCKAAERGMEPDLCPLRCLGGGVWYLCAPARVLLLNPAKGEIRPAYPQRSAPQPTGSGSFELSSLGVPAGRGRITSPSRWASFALTWILPARPVPGSFIVTFRTGAACPRPP